ncbi:MAG: hypothetical protein IPI65_22780 [Bacteroidetes bacterium]|nr:hypothetical protein [Bacteroidota bacterium]
MKQSEIWLIDLDPTKGAEIQKKDLCVRKVGQKIFQNRRLLARSLGRLKKLGDVDEATFNEIKEAIRKVLDI